MNQLHVGSEREVTPPLGGYFWIGDKLPKVKNARVFDYKEHCFDLCAKMTYEKAVAITAAILALFPGGPDTLTKEDASHVLLEALLEKPKTLKGLIPESKDSGREKARRMVERILMFPVLNRVLCGEKRGFSFNANWRSVILCRINRAELVDFDTRALVYFFMAQYDGQFVIPDYGPYALNEHIDIVEREKLIVGVNFLEELPDKLRQRCLLIPDKVLSGATVEDAETVAKYRGLVRGTNAFKEYVEGAVG